ncbi:hypothetical protein [Pseudorhodoferax sp.]|uniref:hypothetical protein n=1 Tax=Pseudorhodoferax sp. TaxID=1993553 RepID=UPI0039E58C8B
MCIGATGLMALQAASAAGGMVSNLMAGNAQARQLEAQAAGERDTGVAQAERILRATRRERGAARAGIAASGTALDEFSLINEQAIQEAGEMDAAMSILTGQRRARATQTQAAAARAEGRIGAMGSLLNGVAGVYSGWKGAKGGGLGTSLGGSSAWYTGTESMGD